MLENYTARTGRIIPVRTIEIQTLAEDADRLLDAVMQVHPLGYRRCQRNASISVIGQETTQPEPRSTTATHKAGFQTGTTETYPMVELKIPIERDLEALEPVMDALIDAHHDEEPGIFMRQDRASRTVYDPNRTNPNRWWNNGRGLPHPLT